jgi:sugar O-acyltransferase (sialic acid O-acetyltransferase NeuD family)
MPNSSPLAIVGAGGLGREVAALVESMNEKTSTWSPIGFVDDADELQNETVMGYPVWGRVRWLSRQSHGSYVLAIGDGSIRNKIAETLDSSSIRPATMMHPSVSLHRTTTVEAGTILCKGVAPTVNVHIGPHGVIDQHCTIGHDSTLAAFVTLHPGARVSGSVSLERGVTLGAGSVVLPETRIGMNATVGAGAVVTDDLPADCTAVGIPARPQS